VRAWGRAGRRPPAARRVARVVRRRPAPSTAARGRERWGGSGAIYCCARSRTLELWGTARESVARRGPARSYLCVGVVVPVVGALVVAPGVVAPGVVAPGAGAVFVAAPAPGAGASVGAAGFVVPGLVVAGAAVVAGGVAGAAALPGMLCAGAPAWVPVSTAAGRAGELVELPASSTRAATSTPSASAATIASRATGALQLGVAASRVRAAAPQERHQS